MSLQEKFNRSGYSIFLNSMAGRIFRFVAGVGFIAVGILYRDNWLGLFSIVWGILAMIAGGFDVCFFSVSLGGPFPGAEIRSKYQ